MSDIDGDYDPEKQIDYQTCPKCGKNDNIWLKVWHSHCGGYEDNRYECKICYKVWWIDGPDS